MKVVKKVYKFMDNLYLEYDVAENDVSEWLHKENIKTVYIVIDQEELEQIERKSRLLDQLDIFSFLNPYTFETLEQAEQEAKTENSYL